MPLNLEPDWAIQQHGGPDNPSRCKFPCGRVLKAVYTAAIYLWQSALPLIACFRHIAYATTSAEGKVSLSLIRYVGDLCVLMISTMELCDLQVLVEDGSLMVCRGSHRARNFTKLKAGYGQTQVRVHLLHCFVTRSGSAICDCTTALFRNVDIQCVY